MLAFLGKIDVLVRNGNLLVQQRMSRQVSVVLGSRGTALARNKTSDDMCRESNRSLKT